MVKLSRNITFYHFWGGVAVFPLINMPSQRAKDFQKLNTIFYTPKHAGSYSSAHKLYQSLKSEGYTIPLTTIQKWLEGQETYSLHRKVIRKFQRNRVIVSGIDSQWDADLLDMSHLSKSNRPFKYVLLCIDILSRFVWVVPLKSKNGKVVLRAFQKVFARVENLKC